jgi:hypothetical protein
VAGASDRAQGSPQGVVNEAEPFTKLVGVARLIQQGTLDPGVDRELWITLGADTEKLRGAGIWWR